MKIFPALLPLLFLALSALGQDKKVPVYLRLLDASDTTAPVNAVLTIRDASGTAVFTENVDVADTFEALENTRYILSTSALQYKPVQTDFRVGNVPVSLDIRLQPTGNELKSVVVVARRSFVRLEDDKEIVDAEPLAAASASAYEVLEKTPGAVVLEGNVYINSSTPAVIQINGREVKLGGENMSALLKSLPANAIVRVEVLRTPSARYDASSSGGIVNIVLKKGVKLGRSGSANASLFQGRRTTASAGATLNQAEGDNTSYIGYQFSNRNGFRILNTEREATAAAAIDQKSYTDFNNQNHNLRGGIDHTFNPRLNLAYDGILNYSRDQNELDNTNRILGAGSGNELSRVLSTTDTRLQNIYFSNVLSSKWQTDTLGSTWENVAEYKLYADRTRQGYENALLPYAQSELGRGNRNSTNHLITLQSDYTAVLPRNWKLEAGARYDVSLGDTRADFETDTNGQGFALNPYQTAHFQFQQRVLGLYLQTSKTFWGFTIKPGLRMEHGFMRGEQTYPGQSDFRIKRTNLFPYLYLRRNLWKMFKIQLVGNLTFRRSIERPDFGMLNPAPRYVDPFLYDVGNPNLRPQLTDKVEATATFMDFPVFSLGYRINRDLFTNVSYQDAATAIAYRTYDNLGRNRELFFRIVGGIPPTVGKYFFFASAEYRHQWYDGQYQNAPLNYDRETWTVFSYHQLKLNKTLNLSAYGFWLFNGFSNFYELEDFGAVNASATKTFRDGKLSVVVSVNDIFRTNRQTFLLSQPGIQATGFRAEDTRCLGLTVRYNFGVKEKKQSGSPFGDMDLGKE